VGEWGGIEHKRTTIGSLFSSLPTDCCNGGGGGGGSGGALCFFYSSGTNHQVSSAFLAAGPMV